MRVQVTIRWCEKERAGPVEEFSFPDPDSNTDLNPIDSFPKTVPSSNSSSIPLVLRAGVGGVASPGCSYCPQPNYTNPAREAKFNGTVLLQVTVSEAGSTVESKVIRGVPFGLNEAAMNAVRDWKFKPATREGEPVTCMVMIEATFRLH
ncbi:MAG: hypothetical protein DMG55_31970 [Acidobacteria bacterium]|nr:MAG: hypothetical protein DMG55_31970 [Acidobacteriota bacterium]